MGPATSHSAPVHHCSMEVNASSMLSQRCVKTKSGAWAWCKLVTTSSGHGFTAASAYAPMRNEKLSPVRDVVGLKRVRGGGGSGSGESISDRAELNLG